MELNSSELITKTQCEKCNGSGYIKQKVRTFTACNGPVSMHGENIDESYIKPYETCDKCYGKGEYILNNLK